MSVSKFQSKSLGSKLTSFVADFHICNGQNATWNKPTTVKSAQPQNRTAVRALSASVPTITPKEKEQFMLLFIVKGNEKYECLVNSRQ